MVEKLLVCDRVGAGITRRRISRAHRSRRAAAEVSQRTHDFYQQSHQTGRGDASVSEGIYHGLVMAFNEDRDMITAQHRNLNADAAMLPLWMDAALLQWRRMLEQEVASETRPDV